MDEHPVNAEAKKEANLARESVVRFRDQHRFLILIIGTIVISVVMVIASLMIYNLSGSAQLDLSRPGYQEVSDQVDRTDEITNYSAFGPVNKSTVKEFTDLYDAQAEKAKAVDAFNGDPLNPEVLEFGVPLTAVE